jgi:ribonuclease P protein component
VATRRYTFPRSSKLKSDRLINMVARQGVRESRGPLVVQATPNGLTKCRLGLRTGRVVGNAVQRNRVRRMLREAFRLMQHDLPSGYDVLVTVRPHPPMMLADYQRLLSALLLKVHRRHATPQVSSSQVSSSQVQQSDSKEKGED